MSSLLEIKNLEVSFDTVMGRVSAVRGVDISVDKGEILAVVGESGSGKSVTSLAVMGLSGGKIENGEIIFDGRDILELTEKEMCEIRGNDISMIFQEPMTSLNPVVTIYKQLREVYKIHMPDKKDNCREEIVELLEKLNIPDAEKILKKYPFELSGGLKQRIMIAMGLICNPKLIIADEPTTALDVTTQAEILDILKDISTTQEKSVMIITHDLGVVAEIADRVSVMYFGKIVENCSTEEFFKNACHPYSKDLIGAMPDNFDGRFKSIEGNVPGMYEEVKGCPYFSRCSYASEICKKEEPPVIKISGNHSVRCHRAEQQEV